MPDLKLIPSEMLTLIPFYGGDKRLLSLFLRKCEYIINIYKGVNNPEQDIYVMHAITSRLTGDVAALVSQREDDFTWEELKALLMQRFGDHRTEESIAMELENIHVHQGESYIDFYNRIQSIRTALLSKVNQSNSSYKDLRISMYNNKALEAFLFSLPEYLFSHVRQKTPKTLEQALQIVVEELNFYEQYNLKNKGHVPQSQYRHPRAHMYTVPQQTLFGNPNIEIATPYKSYGQTANLGLARPQAAGGTMFGTQSSTGKFGVSGSQPFGVSSSTASNAQPQGLTFGIPPKNSNASLPTESKEQPSNSNESKIDF